MECRKFKIILFSATNLPDVRNFGDMKVYAKVSIQGETRTSKCTPTDMQGGTNPRWNFPIEITISESGIRQPGVKLCIELICERTFLEDKFVGKVNIPIKSLFDRGLKADRVLSYQVITEDGGSNGRLNILYSFGNDVFIVRNPSSSSGRSSGWKGAVGIVFLVLLGGTLLLLGDECVDDDVRVVERDYEVDDEGRVFYDAN